MSLKAASGNWSGRHLISCRHSTSGACSATKRATCSARRRTELTFQVTMRRDMGSPRAWGGPASMRAQKYARPFSDRAQISFVSLTPPPGRGWCPGRSGQPPPSCVSKPLLRKKSTVKRTRFGVTRKARTASAGQVLVAARAATGGVAQGEQVVGQAVDGLEGRQLGAGALALGIDHRPFHQADRAAGEGQDHLTLVGTAGVAGDHGEGPGVHAGDAVDAHALLDADVAAQKHRQGGGGQGAWRNTSRRGS